MKHFSVAVLTENGTDDEIAMALEPYYTGLNTGNRDIEFTRDGAIKYGVESITRIIDYNKQLLEAYKDPADTTPDKEDRIKKAEQTLKEATEKLQTYTDEDFYNITADGFSPYQIDKDGTIYTEYDKEARWTIFDIGGLYRDTLPIKKDRIRDYSFNLFATVAKVQDIDFYYIDKNRIVELSNIWEDIVENNIARDDFGLSKDLLVFQYKTKGNFISENVCFRTDFILTNDQWIDVEYDSVLTVFNPAKKSLVGSRYLQMLNPKDCADLYLAVVDCQIRDD